MINTEVDRFVVGCKVKVNCDIDYHVFKIRKGDVGEIITLLDDGAVIKFGDKINTLIEYNLISAC